MLIKNSFYKFRKNNYAGKLIIPKLENYKKLKSKISNYYLKFKINDENMSNVLALSKVLNIKENSFLKSLKTFKGLPHRYEVFFKIKISFLLMIQKPLRSRQLNLPCKIQIIFSGFLAGYQKKMTK